MTNKRILMVCEAFTGGVFSYVTQLCNDICEEYDVYLAYAVNVSKKRRPATVANYKQLLDAKIKLIEIPDFGSALKIDSTIKRLRKIAADIQPDIIHLHSSIAGGIGRLAFDGRKYKIVYTPHGYSFVLMGRGIKSTLFFGLEWILGKKKAITLVCTPSEERIAKKLTNNTCYIETGVDVDCFSEMLKGIEVPQNKRFTVYTLGRVCHQKKPAIFNKIAELVPEADFVWVGSGELENLLTAPNISVTGWMPRYEALSIGKGADVFILCSYGEAIAMSLIENMYMGKLCIVSNVMGNCDVINDGINGFVCEEAEDFARKIKEVIREFPNQLGEQAKKDVLTTYNTKVMKEKYKRFYNTIM